MYNLPKTNQLKNLRAVIYSGSIRAAAIATNQTPSAISRSLQELEAIVGSPLLKRGMHGVQLTAIGEIFEPCMNRVLDELERGVEDVGQFINVSQVAIRFGCSHLPAYGILPGIIKRFQDKYPEVKLSVIEGQFSAMADLVRTGKMSFFVGMTMPDISLDEFYVEYLTNAPFYIFCCKGHPLLNSQSLNELKNNKWYLPGGGVQIFAALERNLFPYGKGPDCSILYGDSIAIAQQLILNEGYLSLGPKEIMENEYLGGKLSIINVMEDLPVGRYAIIQRMQLKRPPITKWLTDEIRHLFKSY
jgi:LysR family transcriptional regulator of abg operon